MAVKEEELLEDDEILEDEEEIIEEEEEEELPDDDTEDSSDDEDDPEEDQDEEEEEDDSEDDDDERVVTIGDAEPEGEEEPKKTPGWVKKVREINRRQEAEIKQLKRQLAEKQAAEKEKPVELGERPTMKSVGYDDKKFEAALIEYNERKRLVDAQNAQKAEQQKMQAERWQAKQQQYVEGKKTHAFKDYETAESIVDNTLNKAQLGVILDGAKDSALVVYALGKNPKVLEQVSQITNPVEFAFEIARLETQMKVSSKSTPKPEKRVKGKTGGSTSEATLNKLRKEAAKTGDFTEVIAYRKKMKG